jgi:hypothetical protein
MAQGSCRSYSDSLQIGRSGVPHSLEIGDFYFANTWPNRLWWTRGLFQSVLWLITGVKLPGRGVYHTPQSSVEGWTDENYNSTPHLCLHCMPKEGGEKNRRNYESISIKKHIDMGRLLRSCKKGKSDRLVFRSLYWKSAVVFAEIQTFWGVMAFTDIRSYWSLL